MSVGPLFSYQTITFSWSKSSRPTTYILWPLKQTHELPRVSWSLIETSNPLICSIDTTYVLVIQRECLMWKAALSATRVITPATYRTEFIVSAVDFRRKRRLNVSCKRNFNDIVNLFANNSVIDFTRAAENHIQRQELCCCFPAITHRQRH